MMISKVQKTQLGYLPMAWNASKAQILTSSGQMIENCIVSLRGTEYIQNSNFHIFGTNEGKLLIYVNLRHTTNYCCIVKNFNSDTK